MGKLSCLWVVGFLLIACGESNEPPAGSGGTAGIAGTGGAGVGGGGTGAIGGTGGTGAIGGSGGVGGNCPTGITFNPGTDPNRNMVGATQVCQRLAEIQCAAERCCCPDGNARKYENEPACVSSQRSICVDILTQQVAEDARSGFSATALNTAFAEFERQASTCDLNIVNWGTSQQGFAGVLSGTASIGAECWTPLDLTESSPAAALASCGSINACLGDSISAIPWTCGTRRGEGGRCVADPSCEATMFCENPPDPGANPPNLVLGTCRPRRGDASCTVASQCQSLFCVGGRCVQPSIEAAYCLKP